MVISLLSEGLQISNLQELRDSFRFKNYISISRVFTDPSTIKEQPKSKKKQKVGDSAKRASFLPPTDLTSI